MNTLFVKTSGNKNGEPLVMIHGWGMNSGVWETVRPALEADYFMHWVDLPGYGENNEISADSMENVVDLILSQLPDGIHILGWSLGGLVAQAIAEKLHEKLHKSHPNKLKSLTLVASSPKFSQSDDWQHAISVETLNNFSKNLQDDVEGTLKRFVALQFMGIKSAKDLKKALINEIMANLKYKSAKKGGGGQVKTLKNPHFEALVLGLEILKTADYRKVSYKTPQHWVLADHDRLIPPALINDLKTLRPDDQITLLTDTGHAPFMTHPKEFLACVIPFLESCK